MKRLLQPLGFRLKPLKLPNFSLIVQSGSDTTNEQISQLKVQAHLHKHTKLHTQVRRETMFHQSPGMVVIEIIVRQSRERVAGNESLYIKASVVDRDRSSWLHGNEQCYTSLSRAA